MSTWITAALLLGTDARAADADLPRIAVVGIHQTELTLAAQEVFVARAAETITRSKAASGLGPADVHTAIRGRETVIVEDGLLAEGRRLLADGTNLYNLAQPEEAIASLENAIASLELGVAASNTSKDLWDTWMLVGTCHHAMDRTDAARAAWEVAAAINPERKPSAAMFPPDVVSGYEFARTAAATGGHPIRVVAPAGHTVFVDGLERGVTPLTVPGVLPGPHHVVVRGPEGMGHVRAVVPPGRDTTAVSVTLGPPTLGQAATSAAGRGRQVAGLYQALGTRAEDVDYILLAGVDQGQLAMQLYSARAEAFSREVRVPVTGTADDEAIGVLPLLLALLDESGQLPELARATTAAPVAVGSNPWLASALLSPPTPTEAPVDVAQTPERESKGGKTALIVAGTAGGALLVGGGVAAAVLLTGGPPADGGTIVVGPF